METKNYNIWRDSTTELFCWEFQEPKWLWLISSLQIGDWSKIRTHAPEEIEASIETTNEQFKRFIAILLRLRNKNDYMFPIQDPTPNFRTNFGLSFFRHILSHTS